MMYAHASLTTISLLYTHTAPPDLHTLSLHDALPIYLAIVCQNLQLRAQFSAGRIVDRFDALGVLDGQRGNRGHAVASVRGESLQVRGGAGAARRIKTRDGQQNRRC